MKPKSGGGGDPAVLLARIYADPEDDEPRAVLSDLLQQEGDPRGEFIALQLARHRRGKPSTPAERKLLQTWERRWLGALEPAIAKGDVVFERGFVTRARYVGGGKRLIGVDEWSTVTHIDVSIASKWVGGSGEMLVAPSARRSIRHVVGLSSDDMPILLASAPFAWETLGIRVWRWSSTATLAEGPRKTFAAVTKLVLAHTSGEDLSVTADDVGALLAAWPAVDELEIEVERTLLPLLLEHARLAKLCRLVVRTKDKWTFTFDRAAKSLAIHGVHAYDGASAELAAVLEPLGQSGIVTRASLAMAGKVTIANDVLTQRSTDMPLRALRAAAAKASVTLTIDA